MNARGSRWLTWAWLATLVCAATAWGQTPSKQRRDLPTPAYLYPAGARRGETVTVVVGGRTFRDVDEVWCADSGITGRVLEVERPLTNNERMKYREELEKLRKGEPAPTPGRLAELEKMLGKLSGNSVPPALAETARLEIRVAADAAPGRRELRLRGRGGMSPPMAFVVGDLPEATFPVVTALTPRAKAGSDKAVAETAANALVVQIPAVVNGQILSGETDRIRFAGKAGQGIVVAVQARALTPYLADAVPGWFQATVSLQDAKGRELAYADDYRFQPDPVLAYRLSADGEYTLVVRDALYRGREDFVYRVAIGELPFVSGVFPLGGRAGSEMQFALTGWHLPASVRKTRLATERGTQVLPLGPCEVATGTVPVVVDDWPELLEIEGNNAPAIAMRLTSPVVVNGRIERPGDEDWFEFEAREGEPVVVEVTARRLRSPLDGVLHVFDAGGAMVASNDDTEDKGDGLTTHHADPRVEFTPKTSGRFRARLADTQHHGGGDFAYRVRLGAPRPDFALRVCPSAVSLRPGAGDKATVFVLRRDGFVGPVKLALSGTPDGYRISPAEVPADAEKVEVTVSAPRGAEAGVFVLGLEGTADVGGATVRNRAVAADDRMQAFFYRHLVPAEQWLACVGRGNSRGTDGSRKER